jgi:hypothetical protein
MPLSDVTICITSFLRPGYLLECLRGIRANLPECEVVVIDDSNLPCPETLPDENGCVFAHLPFDSGLPAKRNESLTFTTTKYWVPGHDDFDFGTREARDGIVKLTDLMDTHDDIDVAGGRVDGNPYEGHLEYVPGEYIREHRLKPVPESCVYARVDLTVNYFLARTARIVPWDERMKIGGEHGDWFLEMKQQGRKTVWVPGVNITTLQLGNGPEVQDPRYGEFRGRARSLGHEIFKKKRNIREYRDWEGNKS